MVSYIPERRVEAEEQYQGMAAAAEGFAWHSNDTHAVPHLPFGSHPRVSAGTWNGNTNTGLDGFLWASLRSNNQVQVLADRVGMDTQIETAEVIPDL